MDCTLVLARIHMFMYRHGEETTWIYIINDANKAQEHMSM